MSGVNTSSAEESKSNELPSSINVDIKSGIEKQASPGQNEDDTTFESTPTPTQAREKRPEQNIEDMLDRIDNV